MIGEKVPALSSRAALGDPGQISTGIQDGLVPKRTGCQVAQSILLFLREHNKKDRAWYISSDITPSAEVRRMQRPKCVADFNTG